MRRDMIDHVRRRHNSALQTELAQRMLYQLKLTQPLPTCGLVELIVLDWTATHESHHRGPCCRGLGLVEATAALADLAGGARCARNHRWLRWSDAIEEK